MVRLTTSDFVVDTVGHCFICMEEMSPQQAPPGSSSSSIHSMLYLSRYLKIKMRKVFSEEVSIPESLLEKVEMSTLKVSLCEECASWNSRLSELLWKLEKIEIETASYLQLIHGKLKRAAQDGKSEKMVDRCTDSELMGKLEVAEILRKETMERCSQKLKRVQKGLKVKIQKLSEKDIEVVKQPKSSCNFATSSELNSEGGLDDVKLEIMSDSEGMWVESENDYLDDFEEGNEDSTQGNISSTVEHDLRSGSPETRITSSKHQNYISNFRRDCSETGKYECKLCVKTFASHSGFRKHYQRDHLKIGVKCKICNTEFSNNCNLKAHHKYAHLKLRFNCQFCNKSFTTPSSRSRHIRLTMCEGVKTNGTPSKRQDYSQSNPQEQICIKLEVKT